MNLEYYYERLDEIVKMIKEEYIYLNDIEYSYDYKSKLETVGVNLSYADLNSDIIAIMNNEDILLNGNKKLPILNFAALYLTMIYYHSIKINKTNELKKVFYAFESNQHRLIEKVEILAMRFVFPTAIQSKIKKEIEINSNLSYYQLINKLAIRYNSHPQIIECFIKQDYKRMLVENLKK